MKGRGYSGRREGKGRLRLIGTHSASVLPAKEVRGELLVLRAAGCYTRRFGTYSVSSTVVLFSLVFLLRLYTFYGPGCRINVCICERFCHFRCVVVPIAKFFRGNNGLLNHKGCESRTPGS
jgi:hypothetical protein